MKDQLAKQKSEKIELLGVSVKITDDTEDEVLIAPLPPGTSPDGNSSPPDRRSYLGLAAGLTAFTLVGLSTAYLRHVWSADNASNIGNREAPEGIASATLPTNQTAAPHQSELGTTLALATTTFVALFTYLGKKIFLANSTPDDEEWHIPLPTLEDIIADSDTSSQDDPSSPINNTQANSPLNLAPPMKPMGHVILAVANLSTRIGVSVAQSGATSSLPTSLSTIGDYGNAPPKGTDPYLNTAYLLPWTTTGVRAQNHPLNRTAIASAAQSQTSSKALDFHDIAGVNARESAHDSDEATTTTSSIQSRTAVFEPEEVITDEEMAEAIWLIDRLNVPNLPESFAYETNIPSERKKRSTSDERAHIDKDIQLIINNKNRTRRTRILLRKIYNNVLISDDVMGFPKEQPQHEKSVYILIKFIQEMQAAIAETATLKDLKLINNFFYIASQELRSLSQTLSPEIYKDLYELEKERRAEEWKTSRRSFQSTNLGKLGRHIRSFYPEWVKYGITGKDMVIIHTSRTSRKFTLAQIFNKKHRSFVEGDISYYHFQFDNSGLPDEQLSKFANTGHKKKQQDALATINSAAIAKEWVEGELKKKSRTPLYFQRTNLIQKKIDGISKSNKTLSDSKQDLLAAFIKLGLHELNLGPEDQLLLNAANTLILDLAESYPDYFTNLDVRKLLSSDYLGTYKDENGDIRTDVTTLANYVNRFTFASNLGILERDNFKLIFPKEFSEDLISALEIASDKMHDFSLNFRKEIEIAAARNTLNQLLPNTEEILNEVLDSIAKEHGIANHSSPEKIKFVHRYGHLQIPPYQEITTELVFTPKEILQGYRRKWVSEAHRFSNEKLEEFSGNPPNATTTAYVKTLEDFDTQEYVISKILPFKDNLGVKEKYDTYVRLLSAQVPGNLSWRYEFSKTPLIAIYFSRQPQSGKIDTAPRRRHLGGRGSVPSRYISPDLSIPIIVQSLVTGKIYHFDSLRKMLAQLQKDSTLRASFRAHFDVDEDLKTPLTLVATGSQGSYERTLDREIRNVDIRVRSHQEAYWHGLAQTAQDLAFILTIPTMFLNPVAAFSIGLVLSPGSILLQAAIADTQQERDALFGDAAVSALFEFLGEGFGKVVNRGIINLVKKTKPTLNIPKHTLDSSDSLIKKLGTDIAPHCSIRVKRGIEEKLCTLSMVQKQDAPSTMNTILQGLRNGVDKTKHVLENLIRADFANSVVKHPPSSNIRFDQKQDFINLVGKNVESMQLDAWDGGVCRGLSLAWGIETLHGDPSGKNFLESIMRVAKSSTSGDKNLVPNGKVASELFEYIDQLQHQQTSTYAKIIPPVENPIQLHLEAQSAWAKKNGMKSKISIADSVKSKTSDTSDTSLFIHFRNKVNPHSTTSIKTMQDINELKAKISHSENSVIEFQTPEHAMAISRVDGVYSFFEPNFGAVGFKTWAEFDAFLTTLLTKPGYNPPYLIETLTFDPKLGERPSTSKFKTILNQN